MSPFLRFLLKALLGLSFLFSVPAFAELRGAELVEAEMRPLHAACVRSFGAERAAAFFADWEPQDLVFLRTKFAALLEITDPQKPFVPTTDRLAISFQTHIFGCSGEVYGNVLMRRQAAERAGLIYMDSHDYDRLNPAGNKPDGLLYRIEEGDLTIYRIMESKLGTSAWSNDQIAGFLRQWSRRGITVLDGDGQTSYFGPERISLGETDIGEATVELVRISSVLVSTRSQPAFPGTLARLPFSATELRDAALYYIDELRGARSAPPRSRHLPAPQIEGPAEEEFQKTLEEFLVEHRRWPRSSDGPIGQFLARNINRRGGQAIVFIQDVPGHLRHFLTVWGSLPALHPLASRLVELDPADPQAPSVIRAYIRKYESRKNDQPSPLHDALVARDERWRNFFEAHPLNSLRGADLVEVNECLRVLLAVQNG